jgi:ribosomal protein L40E
MLAMYQPIVEPSWLRLLIVGGAVIAVLTILFTAMRNRRHVAESDIKLCPGCATPNPAHAEFCRKCGGRLKSE